MKLTVNTFQSICYELDDKDIPDEVKKNDYEFDNWSDDEIASYFEKHGKEVQKISGVCGYNYQVPDNHIEWGEITKPEKPKTTQEDFNECLTRWSKHG